MKRSPLRPGKGFKPRAKPLASFGSARQATPKRTKSRGMKGRTPTADEQRFMDRAGALPCMACVIDGIVNHHISLHHTDGRTKPGSHYQTLPLCAPHHQQDDSDPLQRQSIHGRKATFTALYGTEAELLAYLYTMLNFTPP